VGRVNVLAAIVGFLLGCALTVISLMLFGSTTEVNYLQQVHPEVHPQEFGMSAGTAWYFLCVTAGLIIGATALFTRKMSVTLRTFLVACAVPLLGFWAICSFFSIMELTRVQHY